MGQLKSETYDTSPSNRMKEYDEFPKFAVKYDLPANSLIPYNIYRYIWMNCTTRVTATGDFVACSNYGHQKLAGTPSAAVTENGMNVGISFNYVNDSFFPGSIRVYM